MLKHPQIGPDISLGPQAHVPKWLPQPRDVSTKLLPRVLTCLARLDPAYLRPEPVSPHMRYPHLPLSWFNPIHAMDPARISEAY